MRLKERKVEQAVSAVLGAKTTAEAAERVGISQRTMLRWQADPSFQACYREESRRMLKQTTDRLRDAADRALETLERAQAEAPLHIRVAAAKAVLEHVRHVRQVAEQVAERPLPDLSKLSDQDLELLDHILRRAYDPETHGGVH